MVKKALISFTSTKKASRTGVSEQVIIFDELVVISLKRSIEGLDKNEYIYDGSTQRLGEDIRWSAKLFGLVRPDLTAYALRLNTLASTPRQVWADGSKYALHGFTSNVP